MPIIEKNRKLLRIIEKYRKKSKNHPKQPPHICVINFKTKKKFMKDKTKLNIVIGVVALIILYLFTQHNTQEETSGALTQGKGTEGNKNENKNENKGD